MRTPRGVRGGGSGMGADGGEVVIDLGYAAHDDDEAGPPTPARRELRTLLVFGCVLLMLVTLAGSVTAKRHPGAGMFRIPLRQGGQPFTTDNSVFVFNAGNIVAYRLDDGVKRWEHRYELSEAYAAVDFASGTTIIMGAGPGDDGVEATMSTGVASSTGEQRWRVRGEPLYTSGDAITVIDFESDDPTITSLAASTGVSRWQMTLPHKTKFGYTITSQELPMPDPPAEILILRPDHTLASIALATGTVAEIGTLADVGRLDAYSADTVLTQIYDDPNFEEPTASQAGFYVAYDRATLHELWRLPITDNDGYGLYACGDALCRGGSQPAVMDWRTGRPLWTQAGVDTFGLVWHRADGDLIVAESVVDAAAPKHQVLLNRRTGVLAYDLPREWQFAGSQGRDLLMLLPWNARDKRSWIGVIRAGGPPRLVPITPLGGPDEPVADCFVQRLLVCRQGTGLFLYHLDALGIA